MSKVLFITGASSGIGAATARAAVDAGHKVALVARSEDKLNDLVTELGEDHAIALPCDVTDVSAQTTAFEAAATRFGQIDAVFANAGLGATGKGTEGGDIDNFRTMIDVNIFALTVTCKLAIAHLKQSKGHLLLTGSRAAHATLPGSVYGATKWFVRGYAENLHAELAEQGVRVTNINPGMVDTPFFDEGKPDALRPEDVAGAVMYALGQPDRVVIPSLQIYPMR
ncbi:SDR family oxidoreductase [Rhodobacteraceae bacterium N5(2021)]|uniref:SDR family oxidoreductase n=1 Tax=Gymnodinialimonas phycosphaerae TaxID=2841589 RepID=A0A975YHU6_9RHOB|nr:SDR family oxidoreductase [Gymnodinialimonas phycosphaerae]MBY4893054.1 SDR family oxidoreductase [Gymnodinialimonas phycosphaerae]